jgi:translation elongation factor EF-4
MTVPSVVYKVKSGIPGMETIVDAPSKIPDLGHDDATF